eukprot:767625-Hanusia_phi.AAC.1
MDTVMVVMAFPRRQRVFLGEDSRVKDNDKLCEAAVVSTIVDWDDQCSTSYPVHGKGLKCEHEVLMTCLQINLYLACYVRHLKTITIFRYRFFHENPYAAEKISLADIPDKVQLPSLLPLLPPSLPPDLSPILLLISLPAPPSPPLPEGCRTRLLVSLRKRFSWVNEQELDDALRSSSSPSAAAAPPPPASASASRPSLLLLPNGMVVPSCPPVVTERL